MAISRAQLLKELVPGLNALFGLEYAKYDNEWQNCFEVENSDRAFEEETKLSGFDMAPVKPEGDAIAYDNAQEVWTARYNHETIAMGFSITEEAVEDNLYDSLSARYTKALARAMNYTKEVKGANIFNNAFAAGTTYGDGQTLCSTTHPLVSGGNNSNRPTNHHDLNETTLEADIIQIAGWTDERGLLIAAKPRKLIIPVDLSFTAERILKSNLRVDTANNDINAIRSMSAIPEGWYVNHYLTDTDAYFILTDVPNGIKHMKRVGISTSMEGDFDTGNVRYKTRERYSFGVSDPLAVFGTAGA